MDCEETSTPKFKMPLQKELLQEGEILVLLAGDTSFHVQVLCSDLYTIVNMHHEKVSCMFIVNGDMPLVRDIEDRIFPDHSEGDFWILKS